MTSSFPDNIEFFSGTRCRHSKVVNNMEIYYIIYKIKVISCMQGVRFYIAVQAI